MCSANEEAKGPGSSQWQPFSVVASVTMGQMNKPHLKSQQGRAGGGRDAPGSSGPNLVHLEFKSAFYLQSEEPFMR